MIRIGNSSTHIPSTPIKLLILKNVINLHTSHLILGLDSKADTCFGLAKYDSGRCDLTVEAIYDPPLA